jgi:hypothetical protein
MRSLAVLFASSSLLVACGPSGRPDDGINPNGPDGGPVSDSFPIGPEICDDGYDNDQDGRADCADVDCSGVGSCPVCGQVEVPEATPLLLPDGVSTGTYCQTDAQCGPAEPNCIHFLGGDECHASYNSALDFIGFPQGATLTDATQLLKVCVNMEHSWLHDLQMELITPNGIIFPLHAFAGRNGGPTYLGDPNHSESNNVYGTGWDYCWTPTASQTMMQAASSYIDRSLPAGDYKADGAWTMLTGAPLNGRWELRITDLWGIDNGFLFGWKIEFDPTLVVDCSGPIIF